MLRGLYISASGMATSLQRNDTISNNLANINTTGYKKQRTIEKSFSEQMLVKMGGEKQQELGTISGGSVIEETATDYSPGEFKKTNNDLDWAISGKGFFAIQTPGGVKYTKQGNFTINNAGQVVTQKGYPVRGENGILQLPNTNSSEIVVENNNLMVDGTVVDKIKIVDFPNKSALIREGSTLFKRNPQSGNGFTGTGQILQGYLENSNVNPIEEMTKMISNNRRVYQASQKAIQAYDDTLDKTVNQVGKA